jgi:hypothetical protein
VAWGVGQRDEPVARVVFLGGLGRSGSTLVERLLGELPGVCSVGEIVHLWQRGVAENERCGCGTAFHDCPFWQQVGDVAFGGWSAVDMDRVRLLRSVVDRTRFVPLLAAPRLPRNRRERVGEYVDLYVRLYAAIRQVSGASVIVDSSKHASLAFCLRWCAGLDLRVLHVVRDSRGVAYSWTKDVQRPDAQRPDSMMARYSPLQASLQWNTQNLLFPLLGRLGTPTRVLRYEDLISEPRATLQIAAAFAGVPAGDGDFAFVSDKYVDLTPSHTVSGNPVRFRTGRLMLRRDDSWRTELPAAQRRTVSAVTLPVLLGHGYLSTLRMPRRERRRHAAA